MAFAPIDSTELRLEAPSDFSGKQFSFSVWFSTLDKDLDDPAVDCGRAVACSIGRSVTEGFFKRQIWTATVGSESPDAVEITAYRFSKRKTSSGQEQVNSQSVIVPLGFNTHTFEATQESGTPIRGGSIATTTFRFKDGDKTVTPALPVQLTISSECARFRFEGSMFNDFEKSIEIKFGDDDTSNGFSDQVEIQPQLWASDSCPIAAQGFIKGRYTTRKTAPFRANITVTPNYLPALIMALLGALIQWLLGSGIRLTVESGTGQRRDAARDINNSRPIAPGANVAIDSAPNKEAARLEEQNVVEDTAGLSGESDGKRLLKRVAFRDVFLGPNWSFLISAFLKGLIAFLVAAVVKDSTIFGISVQRGSFDGFFTLGFLFGFWPIAELWVALAKRAGVGQSSQGH